MPIAHSIISETTDHIHHTIASQLVKKIISQISPHLSFKDAFYLDTGYSTVNQSADPNNNMKVRGNMLTVRAIPMMNPTNLKWNTYTGVHDTANYLAQGRLDIYPTIFADTTVEFLIHELSTPTQMQLEFEIEVKERVNAYLIHNLLSRRYGSNHVHSEIIEYNYPVPRDIINILYEIFKLRKFKKSLSFKEYLSMGSCNLFEYLVSKADLKGTQELVIPKQITDINVEIDGNIDRPEENKINRATTSYTLRFSMVAQYSRVDMLVARYPIVVNNSLISASIVPTRDVDKDIQYLQPVYPEVAAEPVRQYYLVPGAPAPVVFPYYDDWVRPRGRYDTRPFRVLTTVAFTIDGDSTTLAFSDIGSSDQGVSYSLHPTMLEVIARLKQDMFRIDCFLGLDIYVDDLPLDSSLIELNGETLTVHHNNPNAIYRLVLYELTDVRYLDPSFYPIIKEYWPFFEVCTSIQSLIDNGRIVWDKNKWIDDPGNHVLGGINDSLHRLRVLFSDIVAKK